MNPDYITISKVQLKTLLSRQLKLVDENIELRKDIDFRDYRIQKLEETIFRMKQHIITQKQQQEMKTEEKIFHKMINIYV